jgi:signal transduction histidine kinase
MSIDSPERDIPVEQQLAALREQLVHAQKLTALGELVSTTTHEFNNVLMTVINYAKLGLRATDEASRTKAFERILSAGQRAAKITSTILGVARNRCQSFEPTDLAALINDTLVLLEREMRKYRIHVECQFESVPNALVSGNQIQQVLINLLVNARQAMPNGGHVLLRLTHDSQRGTVNLDVRDNGPGIAAETLPRIFDSFFSTKHGPDSSGKGGTGLGLSACKEIIEAHRGRIRVESTVGRGTCFTLMLPVAKPVGIVLPGLNVDSSAQTRAS